MNENTSTPPPSSAAEEALSLFAKLTSSLETIHEKNDRVLEALEAAETKAMTASSSEAPLLKNLRARLSAVHAPNANLVRDLKRAAALFENEYKDVLSSKKRHETRQRELDVDRRELGRRETAFAVERDAFMREKSNWTEKLDAAKREIVEQNDRLADLSERLAGTKTALDLRESELVSERIALEEERLAGKVEKRARDADGGPSYREIDELKRQIKEHIVRAMEAENSKLRVEMELYQACEESKRLARTNERLKRETTQSRQLSTRTLQQFERRTTEANRKLSELGGEVVKAQEHAKRFQDLLVAEKRKQRGMRHALEKALQRSVPDSDDETALISQRAYVQTLSDTLSLSANKTSPMRVEDVVKKNEGLLLEVASLKADVKRLQIENGDLIRKLKGAHEDAHYLRSQVCTNMADRVELQKRLEKSHRRYRQLEASLTRQAGDWITQKKLAQQIEEEMKWTKINPIPVLGASERAASQKRPAQRQSRLIHVDKW